MDVYGRRSGGFFFFTAAQTGRFSYAASGAYFLLHADNSEYQQEARMPAQDLANAGNAITAPAGRFAAITPHASNDLGFVSRAIYVGGAGDIAAVDVLGNVVTFKAVPAGTLLPIRVARINAVGTTAIDLIALW